MQILRVLRYVAKFLTEQPLSGGCRDPLYTSTSVRPEVLGGDTFTVLLCRDQDTLAAFTVPGRADPNIVSAFIGELLDRIPVTSRQMSSARPSGMDLTPSI